MVGRKNKRKQENRGLNSGAYRDVSSGFLFRIHDFAVVDDEGIARRPLAEGPADRFGEFGLGVAEEQLQRVSSQLLLRESSAISLQGSSLPSVDEPGLTVEATARQDPHPRATGNLLDGKNSQCRRF